MKTLFFISAFLFAVLATVFGSESNLTLTYSQHKTSRDFNVKVNSQSISYEVTAKQGQDGLFNLEAPPFFCANINDTVILGELRDQGILALMLEPFGTSKTPYRFHRNANLKNISNLSQSPTLSGIALCFDNIDIIALSPTMNPRSPLGMGIVAGSDNLFAGVIYAGQNDRYLQAASCPFQTNWSTMGQGRDMIFSIVGAHSSAKIMDTSIESSAFVQNAWDLLLGGGTSCGWNLRLKSEKITTALERRLGGIGVNLKSAGPKERPCESLSFGTTINGQDKMQLTLDYKVDTYGIPLYGGQSQRRTINWEVGATLYDISMKATSRTSYDADRAKVSDTTYLISTKQDGVTIKASVKINRNVDHSSYASDATFEVLAPKATLEIKNGKAKFAMNWQKEIEDLKIKVSVDQDRYLSLSVTMNRT